MKRTLLVVLALAAGCKKEKKEEAASKPADAGKPAAAVDAGKAAAAAPVDAGAGAAAPAAPGTLAKIFGAVAITGKLSNEEKDPAALACEQNAASVTGDPGTSWYVSCPAGCQPANLWGTDLYTDDSSICSAAIHAGTVDRAQGGTVLVTFTNGQATYIGTQRNDFASSDYGRWGRSFFTQKVDDKGQPTTPSVAPLPEFTAQLTCEMNAGSLAGNPGTQWKVLCPAGCKLEGNIWGTDVYTDDSAVCVAAVHAGVLAAGQAGEIQLMIGGPVDNLTGSARNGVTTNDYGAYGRTFKLSK